MGILAAGIAGWPQAVILNNGLISAAIVPEAARVLTYSFGGRNLFFVNEAERGRVYAPSANAEWHNFGGARFDVAPQSSWASTRWGKAWPPPPFLNTGREFRRDGDAIYLGAPRGADNVFDLGIGVFVRAVPDSTVIAIEQSIENVGASHSRYANWIVAQLAAAAGASTVYVPSYPASRFESGYTVQMESAAGGQLPIRNASAGSPLAFPYNGTEWKFGFDGRGWIALRPSSDSDVVFALVGSFDPGLSYPDDNCTAECYTAAHMPYVELELLGPLADLAPGARRLDIFKWAAASVSGPVVDVTDVGIVGEPLHVSGGALKGAFGVFFTGSAKVVAVSKDGGERIIATATVSPERPYNLDLPLKGDISAAGYRIDVYDDRDEKLGTLSETRG